MQKCEKCGRSFRWKDVLFSIWQSYKPITCSHCNTKQTINFTSKFIVSFMVLLLALVVIFYLAPANGWSKPATFGVALVVVFCITFTLPTFVRYEVPTTKR